MRFQHQGGFYTPLFISLIAIALPAMLSLYWAREQALGTQQQLAHNYAEALLRSSEQTTDELYHVTAMLNELPGAPCDRQHQELM